jgi:hypothetical protein
LSNLSKITTSFVAALALVAVSIANAPAAHAAGMTLSQWQQSSGYLLLDAAITASDAKVQSFTGLAGTLRIDESGSSIGSSTTETADILATKTSSKAHYSIVDNDSKDSNSFDYYFVNGTYVESIDCFQTGALYVNDLAQTLKRLGKPGATAVNDHTTTKLEGLPDITPSKFWSTTSRDPLGDVVGPNYVLSYSDVTSAPDTNTPSSTVYSWTASFVLKTAPVEVNLAASVTFDSNGVAVASTVEEHASGGLYDLVAAQTLAAHNDAVITAPSPSQTVDVAALVAMGHKVDAEASVMPKAKAIAAKAKALAKAAKKALTASHITAAAKALKAKTSAVKNGVKLTGKSASVSGSLCITAVRGAATIASCK